MKAQEKRENIKIFEDVIAYINDHFEQKMFICNILDLHLPKHKCCGYDDRMLPNAKAYFISQRPTPMMNRHHYKAVSYIQNRTTGLGCIFWWDHHTHSVVIANMDRIRFLKHLISKLKR